MKQSITRRFLGVLLTLCMVFTLLPVSALAVTSGKPVIVYFLNADQKRESSSQHENFSDSDTKEEEGEEVYWEDKVSGSAQDSDGLFYNVTGSGVWNTSASTIDLWVTSTDMTKTDGSEIPNVKDWSNNTWYLSEIGIASSSAETNYQTLVTKQQIVDAAASSDKTAYIIQTSSINFEAEKYCVIYLWSTTNPETTTTPTAKTAYSVEYKWNNSDGKTIIPAQNGAIFAGDGSLTEDNFVNNPYVENVNEGLNFTVGDKIQTDYLAYKTNSDGTTTYYAFAGWKTEAQDDTATEFSKTGYILTASSALAGEDKTITLTAQWKKIEPLTEAQLTNAPEVLLLATGSNAALIQQWTDSAATSTTKDVELDDDGTIYYKATVQMTSEVAGTLSGKKMNNEDFANFNITVQIDSNLVLADGAKDTNGNVSFTFTCPFLKPTGKIKVGNSEVDATVNGAEPNWTITVAASNITNEDGTIKTFTIPVKWIPGSAGTVAELTTPMTLSGIALQRKADLAKDVVISTTGTITGTIDFTKTNARVPFQAAAIMLNTSTEWSTFFGGTSASPVALAHAVEYLKNSLADSENSKIDGNTVKAVYPSYTITATADSNGSISDLGDKSVYKGDSKTYTITPNSGYHVDKVLVDGNEATLTNGTYTFTNVTANHSISVTFAKDNASSGGGSGGSSGGGDSGYAPGEGPLANKTDAELDKERHEAYVYGYPDGTVQPTNNITREEVATIFFRLLTDSSRAKYITSENPFPDVENDRWSHWSITTLNNAGIMTGRDNGNFDPAAPITRAELAVVASQFSQAVYNGEDKFSDITNHWAKDYINEAASEGWVAGYPDGTFGPDRYITRAEVMALINEVLGRMPDADNMLSSMIDWPDNPESAWYYEDVQEATNSHDYNWITNSSNKKTGEDWVKIIDMRPYADLVNDALNG